MGRPKKYDSPGQPKHPGDLKKVTIPLDVAARRGLELLSASLGGNRAAAARAVLGAAENPDAQVRKLAAALAERLAKVAETQRF